jgi:hypothetical protein
MKAHKILRRNADYKYYEKDDSYGKGLYLRRLKNNKWEIRANENFSFWKPAEIPNFVNLISEEKARKDYAYCFQ